MVSCGQFTITLHPHVDGDLDAAGNTGMWRPGSHCGECEEYPGAKGYTGQHGPAFRTAAGSLLDAARGGDHRSRFSYVQQLAPCILPACAAVLPRGGRAAVGPRKTLARGGGVCVGGAGSVRDGKGNGAAASASADLFQRAGGPDDSGGSPRHLQVGPMVALVSGRAGIPPPAVSQHHGLSMCRILGQCIRAGSRFRRQTVHG